MATSFLYGIYVFNCKTKKFKETFEAYSAAGNLNACYYNLSVGNDLNAKRIVYLFKDDQRQEYMYPFTTQFNHIRIIGTDIFKQIKEAILKQYNEILTKYKKVRYSTGDKESNTKATVIDSIYKNTNHVYKEEYKVYDPQDIDFINESGKLECFFTNKIKNNPISHLKMLRGKIEICLDNRISDVKDVECNTFRILVSDYNKSITWTINDLKTYKLYSQGKEHTLVIKKLNCSQPVEIQLSSGRIKILKINGDKQNIKITLTNTKNLSEDNIEIEGLPYSQWKNKFHVNKATFELKGKTFLATGKIIIGKYNTRDAIYSLIKAAGGRIAKDQKEFYDYLITDMHFTNGVEEPSKLKDARRRGIIPISGKQLQEMLEAEGIDVN